MTDDGANQSCVGFVRVGFDDTVHLLSLYVDPGWQRRGIGGSLLGAAHAICRARGVARIHVAASLNAAPFYARRGYVWVEMIEWRPTGVDNGPAIPAVTMTLALSSNADMVGAVIRCAGSSAPSIVAGMIVAEATRLAGALDVARANRCGEQAGVADAVEAARQDVPEKGADELGAVERHGHSERRSGASAASQARLSGKEREIAEGG